MNYYQYKALTTFLLAITICCYMVIIFKSIEKLYPSQFPVKVEKVSDKPNR